MESKITCGFALCSVAAAMLMPASALGQTSTELDRISSNEKGSMLMWSHFRVAWQENDLAADGDPEEYLFQDTILQFTNDSPNAVDVQFYVVAPEWIHVPGEPEGNGDYEQVWRNFDIGVTLTGNQPAWWSMANGGGTFPGMPSVKDHFEGSIPFVSVGGEPKVISGYVYAWAVETSGDSENVETTHNHLSGQAQIINYGVGFAYAYGAWAAARATDAGPGDATLNLDGDEYDTCFSHLLYNFEAYSELANPPFAGLDTLELVTFDLLTLHIVDANFDADVPGAGTYKTKAHFDVWNEYEIKLSGQYRCIDCWDNWFTPEYNQGPGQGGPNHLTEENLGTEYGKARITSVSDTLLCEGNGIDGEYAMLGIAATLKKLLIPPGYEDWITSGNNLVGMGERAAVITYPLLDVPPVAPEGPVGAMDAFLGDIKKAARSSK